MRTPLFLALTVIYLTGCPHASLQTPQAVAPGEITTGIHGVALANLDVESDSVIGTAMLTSRIGTEFGEIGFNAGALGAEGTIKLPITDRAGNTHISIIGGAGLHLWLFPDVNIGLLAGQQFGTTTLYAGYRQHATTGFGISLVTGNAIVGTELQVSDTVAVMLEYSHSFVYRGNFTDTLSADEFDVEMFTIGLNFGRKTSPLQTLPPPPPPPVY